MNQQGDLHFNLVDQPWIPVTLATGDSVLVSLRELFARAHEIRAITGDLALEYIALVRLALAVLYRTYSWIGEDEGVTNADLLASWNALYANGQFAGDAIDAYLDEQLDRFDLFGTDPFYQVAGLAYAAKDPDPVLEFIMDMPKPEKYLFSMRSYRSAGEISFAEAARQLVLAQNYDLAGIKSPVVGSQGVKGGKVYAPKGLLGTGWLGAVGGVFFEGRTLFETLMRNWVLVANGKRLLGIRGDLPPWERSRPVSYMVEREPAGPVDLLTWQSRRICLVSNEEGTAVSGVVMCYGDVTRAADKYGLELMTGWRASEAQRKKLGSAHAPLMPVALDPSRALWRGLPSLLGVSRERVGPAGDLRAEVIKWNDALQHTGADASDFSVRLRALGVSYGSQSSVIDAMVDDGLDLCASMVRKDSPARVAAIEVVQKADEAVKAFARFTCNVRKANGEDRPTDDKVAQETAYDALDNVFRQKIAAFGPNEDVVAYCAEWCREIRSVLERLARAYLSAGALSAFRESEEMTAGRAIAIFQAQLARVLGSREPAPVGMPDTAVKEEEA